MLGSKLETRQLLSLGDQCKDDRSEIEPLGLQGSPAMAPVLLIKIATSLIHRKARKSRKVTT